MGYIFKKLDRLDKILKDESYQRELTGGLFYYEKDNWDDYGYCVTYHLAYCFPDDFNHIGFPKIFKIGSLKLSDGKNLLGEDTPSESDILEKISSSQNHLSIGADLLYYKNLITLENMSLIDLQAYLKQLNDIAYNFSILKSLKSDFDSPSLVKPARPVHRPTRIYDLINDAFLRHFEDLDYLRMHKLANRQNFFQKYLLEINNSYLATPLVLRPSSNIQDEVLNKNIFCFIGSNGVGKTRLLKSIYNSFINGEMVYTNTNQDFRSGSVFFFSMSPFDSPVVESQIGKYFGVQMNQVSLKEEIYDLLSLEMKEKYRENAQDGIFIKTGTETQHKDKFFNIFIHSVNTILLKNNFPIWIDLVERILQDKQTYFDNFDNFQKNINRIKSNDPSDELSEFQKIIPFMQEQDILAAADFYDSLFKLMYHQSSGVSYILLLLTYAFAAIEENSLILIDEPENHLQPPMLARLLDNLSWICRNTNSISILATHSPVTVQELVKDNVFILKPQIIESEEDPKNRQLIAFNPDFNTFGENIGTINRKIFNYEIETSGFYKKLRDFYTRYKDNYEVRTEISSNAGFEAITIIENSAMFFDSEM
ncbi:AAA family ATPase [Rothia sp. P5766]|uniref:AAA family ATPase n=1 Tax=Rothia sp. P5766 TaxID=3402656 RepID=UPI003AE825AA